MFHCLLHRCSLWNPCVTIRRSLLPTSWYVAKLCAMELRAVQGHQLCSQHCWWIVGIRDDVHSAVVGIPLRLLLVVAGIPSAAGASWGLKLCVSPCCSCKEGWGLNEASP